MKNLDGEPKIEIILGKNWGHSHVYVNGIEIPVLTIEVAEVDGNHPFPKVRLTIMPEIIKIYPAVVEWIEHKIDKPPFDLSNIPVDEDPSLEGRY